MADGQRERYVMIDVIRGGAILLMIFYHLVFDLNFFRLVAVPFIGSPYWIGFAKCIVFLFLICVGMGLALSHKDGIRWNRVIKRFFKIGGWAVIITIVTCLLLPKNFIYFGILHCIAATSVAGVFFVRWPRLCLILSILLFIPDLIYEPKILSLSERLGVHPADYIPFYPWFGVVLFGIYLESIHFHKIQLRQNVAIRSLEALGRHSLKIYLLHQPIMMGLLFLILKLAKDI